MALAPARKLVSESIPFLVFWVLAVFPSFKLLPIGRTGGAIAGAVLTVVLQVDSPKKAYESVDLSILGLLFGTMVISLYLERADMFRYLGSALSWKSKGGKDLICRICILSAISSAFFTNDTSCIILTEFVLKLCRQKGLPPKPFLIALATSANIGSSATPIGNPQNLIIAFQSGISFGRFFLGLLPSVLLGSSINTILLLLVYWRQLSPVEETEREGGSGEAAAGAGLVLCLDGEGNPAELPPPAMAHPGSHTSSRESFFEIAPEHFDNDDHPSFEVTGKHEEKKNGSAKSNPGQEYGSLGIVIAERQHQGDGFVGDSTSPLPRSLSPVVEVVKCCSRLPSRDCRRWRKGFQKCGVYLVTAGMLAALLYGLDLSWSALTAAFVLMALDFQDAGPTLDKVSYALLVFFAGMFITIDGFNTTGIPGTFWEAVEPHARINSASGIIVLALVVIALSNIASNVPTVLLLGSRVSSSAASNGASVTRAWLILAWTSTVAGNLTLVGSAANLIVCEQARKPQFLSYELTFWNHLMFGLPSTLIVAAAGLYPIKLK